MTRRGATALAAASSAVVFALALYLRLNAAYGPFNLSSNPSDWTVLWELWRNGQIARGVVAQGAALGALAAAVPWVILGLWRRRERRG